MRRLTFGVLSPCPGVGLDAAMWKCRIIGWRVLWLDLDARFHSAWWLIPPDFYPDSE